ncbi:MAG: hypothetical protein WDO15_08570 [Bacteroidota bacterium]
MLKNYVLTAFSQHPCGYPVYFMINLAGLTLGGVGVLYDDRDIYRHELSFDQFHAKKDRIYRVNYNFLFW